MHYSLRQVAQEKPPLNLPSNATLPQDPLEPLPMRVERPPADEVPPLPVHLEASVRRPTAGIGPEARLAGLDERTELRVIVPRCVQLHVNNGGHVRWVD